MHLHVVDGLHHAMICVRGTGSGRDLEAGVAIVVSAALVAEAASVVFVQAVVLVAVLVAVSAVDYPGWRLVL